MKGTYGQTDRQTDRQTVKETGSGSKAQRVLLEDIYVKTLCHDFSRAVAS